MLHLGLAFLSLALVGFFHTVLGAALPAIRASSGWSVAQGGLLGSSTWLGFTGAIFAGGFLSDFFARGRVIALACFMMGASALLFGERFSFEWNCLLIGILGAGTGMIVSTSSALVMELHPRRTGMIMNLHHFFYALGAITGPLSMGYLVAEGWPWYPIYRIGGICLLLLGGAFVLQRKRSGPERVIGTSRSLSVLFKEKSLLLFTGVALFGVGTQNGIALWLVSFLKETRSFPIFLASTGLALFSIGMAAGRLGSGWMAARWSNTRVLFFLLCILTLDLFLFLLIPGKAPLLVLCFFAGFGCSGLFPCLLALGGVCFPQWAGTVMGLLGTAAGIGSTVISWWMSLVSQGLGLETGFFISLLAASIALLLVGISYRRLDRVESRCLSP
jgi:fucose permease